MGSHSATLRPSLSKNLGYEVLVEAPEMKDAVSSMEKEMIDLEVDGVMIVETSSIYGAAVALPQIARSMEWDITMIMIALRGYLLLFLNYVLQGSAIMFIAESSQVMDVMAGKMHLCDFARSLDSCPDGNNCLGPGGTRFSGPRLYSFDIWGARTFVRDSLVTVFPRKTDSIMSEVDPGEYGMESFNCRLLSSFIFIMAEVREFYSTLELLTVILRIPTAPESWVLHHNDDKTKDIFDQLRFVTAGMPTSWKWINVFLVVLPKILLWWNVCWMGMRFLMETSGIVNQVMGAMAMDFILTFDELTIACLGSVTIKMMMGKLEPCATPASKLCNRRMLPLILAVPRKLLFTLFVWIFFMWRYYMFNCETGPDGSLVSKSLYLPKSTYYTLANWFTGFLDMEEEPVWTMPREA